MIPADDIIESRVTNHVSRLLCFLTFTLLSLIFMGSVADVLAEEVRKGTYIRMEETEIIGIIEHPEITYIIPKTRIKFSKIPLERDFSTRATRLTNPLYLEEEVKIRTLLSGP